MFKKMFSLFEELSESLDNNNIAEISVKQSMISISFEDMSFLSVNDLDKIDGFCNTLSVSSITTFQDILHVHFANLNEDWFPDSEKCSLAYFYKVIFELRDILCTCPALEYVISSTYLKIYIDLPNIHVKDVGKLDTLFNSEGVLELNNQRPYVLYVKDW